MRCEIIQVAVEINRSKDRAESVQMQNYKSGAMSWIRGKSSYHRWIISPDAPYVVSGVFVEVLNDDRPFSDVIEADRNHQDQLELTEQSGGWVNTQSEEHGRAECGMSGKKSRGVEQVEVPVRRSESIVLKR